MSVTSQQKVQKIEAELAKGLSLIQISRALSVSTSVVGAVKRREHYHQQSPEEQRRRHPHGSDPSPSEIAARCAEIRASKRESRPQRPDPKPWLIRKPAFNPRDPNTWDHVCERDRLAVERARRVT